VFEGFAGIGAVSKAMERLNIPHELVGFSEIDKYAIKSFGLIHKVDEKLNSGDVCLIDETKLPDFDLYTFGSPCQDFSVAGKQKGSTWTCNDCNSEYNPLDVHYSKRNTCPECNSENISKTRSSLVVEALRIIKYKKPKYLLMENVKGLVGKQFKPSFDKIIAELQEYGYNTYWKVLNAKDYGIPQNRERVFVISVRKDIDNGQFKFPEEFDNGIRLRDLLESEVDEKYYISRDKTEKLLEQLKDKGKQHININELNIVGNVGNTGHHGLDVYSENGISPCLKARDFKDPIRIMQTKAVEVRPCLTPDRIEKRQNGRRFKDNDEPAFTINTQDKHGILMVETSDINNNELVQVGMLEGKGFETRRRVYDPKGISPTLHGIGSGGNTEPKIIEENTNSLQFVGGIDTTDKWIDNDKDFSRNYKEGYRVYDSEGIACCQKTNGGGLGSNTGLYLENTYRIRKLTPLECFRLMGFDDEDYYILKENGISNSQIYKMAGNSIVVNVLEEIFKELFNK